MFDYCAAIETMMTSNSLHTDLKQIIGESGILQKEQISDSDYTFDGITPTIVVLPASVKEVQAVLHYASDHDLTVIPSGAGTKLGIGNLPEKCDIVLALTRLNNVIEYEPADLTVTVEAGIRLADLQTELSKNRQFLPINPPYANRCTIGGIVSTNSSGPLRLRYGTARNQVLGLRVVHASGTVVKSGGKVVKNVAGYDLNKLYIGAYGTLGIISEVTLKLAPLPIRQAIIAAQFQSVQDAVKTGLNVVSSQTLPTFVNLSIQHPIKLFSENKSSLIIGFGGEPETVTWQLDTVKSLLEQNSAISVQTVEGELHNSICDEIQNFPNVVSESDNVIIKVNLKRTDITQYLQDNFEDTHEVMAQLGNGILHLKFPVSTDTDIEKIIQMRQRAIDVGGNLIIESGPPELKRQIDVWGPIGNTQDLMKQIKAKFDEKMLLNPGRFVSGL